MSQDSPTSGKPVPHTLARTAEMCKSLALYLNFNFSSVPKMELVGLSTGSQLPSSQCGHTKLTCLAFYYQLGCFNWLLEDKRLNLACWGIDRDAKCGNALIS